MREGWKEGGRLDSKESEGGRDDDGGRVRVEERRKENKEKI